MTPPRPKFLALTLLLAAGCAAAPPPIEQPPSGPFVPAWVEQLDETREAVLACASAAPTGARVVNVTPLRDGATGVILLVAASRAVMCACTGGETTLADVALEPEALVDLPQLLVGHEPDHPTQTEVPPHGQRVGWLYWPTRAELLREPGAEAPTTQELTSHELAHEHALHPFAAEPTP